MKRLQPTSGIAITESISYAFNREGEGVGTDSYILRSDVHPH